MNFFRHSLFTISLLCVAPTAQAAEKIDNFSSLLEVESSGVVQVTETIQYDFGAESKHGIFRILETGHPQPATTWYKERYIAIEIESVEQDGNEATYEVTELGKRLEVKIGDADETLVGTHTYTIVYKMHGALSYGPDGTELYYDVTGNEWEVPIIAAQAVVQVPNEAMLAKRSACYQGVIDSIQSCARITSATTSTTFLAATLLPFEGITVAQELNAQAVQTLIVERTMPWLLFALLFTVYAVIAGRYVYRFRSAYNPDDAIIAEYEPYPDALPMYTGLLMDGRLDPKDITAGLLYLAQQGFIKIKKTEKKVMFFFEVDDYELTLLRPATSAPAGFLTTILMLLFTAGTEGETIALSDIKKNQSKQRSNQVQLMELRKALAADLKERGFYEGLPKSGYLKLILGAVAVIVIGLVSFQNELVWIFVVAISTLLVVLLVLGYRRRTSKGFAALNHLKGFKDFLSVTDAERFKFHNAPSKSPEQFLAFLPYAIALGVEKEWSEVFKDITIPTPGWYDGGSINTFSAVALSHDLGAFSTSFSSSSGTSGSSGGGSSGGGGGGGGGGSW